MPQTYPTWKFYPTRLRPPPWVEDVIEVFRSVKQTIDSTAHSGINSNAALAALRPGFEQLEFEVERGRKRAERIFRPVLFGENGKPVLTYEVDGFHSGHGIVVEVEAGRRAANYLNSCSMPPT